MTVKEHFDRFDALFAKLQHNREKVPLSDLQGKYKAAYNALIADLLKEADWWAGEYIACLKFPTLEADAKGTADFYKRYAAVSKREWGPGGLAEEYRAALIDRLDRKEYELTVWKIYDRLEKEAFGPYFQAHCHWSGPPDNRWVYNDIIKKFWWPKHDDPKAYGGTAGGYWISSDWKEYDHRMPPPEIGPDPEKGKDDAGK